MMTTKLRTCDQDFNSRLEVALKGVLNGGKSQIPGTSLASLDVYMICMMHNLKLKSTFA